MRMSIFILISSLALISFQQKKEKKVFICKTVKSKRYHYKKNCRGLSSCKAEIKETTVKKAKRFGRTICKLEKKK